MRKYLDETNRELASVICNYCGKELLVENGNGSSGAITRSAFTTLASPFGPTKRSGSVRSAFPIVRSIPGSPWQSA